MTIPNIRPWHIVNGHEFLIETKHEVMVVVLNGFNSAGFLFLQKCWRIAEKIGG